MPVTSRPAIPPFLLQRRYWWGLLALWAAIVAVSLHFSLQDIHRHNLQVALAGARNMFEMVWLTRQWNASHEAVYVPVDAATEPNPYLRHPRRDVTTTDGQRLTMINPAYMTRLIAEIAQKESQVVFHITSLDPIRPGNAADAWERAILQDFVDGKGHEASSLEAGSGGAQFRYMAPLYVNETCLKCHGQHGYKLGDVRGGISVSQSFAPFEAAAAPSVRKTVAQHVAVFLLVAGLSGWALAQLRRRWLDLEGSIAALDQARNEL
ncbi:Tll0287-like domain-containing protein, partial [Methylogaea oryzae]|uniref:Tll0287-like domain-containing protein n=1 Tax=Methylogaea oryzae TaxID=1295382 RepID=UPI00138F9375